MDAPQSFVQSVIKNLTDLYKMGEGPDFWGGYGASADDLGAFLTALPYADDYKTYIDDAVELLEKNVSDAGYTSWGSANADSTAMALMAYSALDDQEKADKAYDLLLQIRVQDDRCVHLRRRGEFAGHQGRSDCTGLLHRPPDRPHCDRS